MSTSSMTHFNHDVQFGVCRHRYHGNFPTILKKKISSDLELAEKMLNEKSRTSYINRLIFICASKSPLSFTRHCASQSSGSHLHVLSYYVATPNLARQMRFANRRQTDMSPELFLSLEQGDSKWDSDIQSALQA